MRMIISTEHKGIVKFLFQHLRTEASFPVRDNFILEKELNSNEFTKLERFNNYIILSNNFFTHSWEKQDIIDFVREKIKARRKPNLDFVKDDEFEALVKIFSITGKWPQPDEDDQTMFDLYKNIDMPGRLEIMFNLLEKMPPRVILYSVLTFVQRCFLEDFTDINKYYTRLIHSKKRTIRKNFKRAIRHYADFPSSVTDDLKLIRFIYDIGKL